MTSDTPVIYWFRSDLRLADNAALHAAAATGKPLILVYILDDEGPRSLGGASRWWLHHSLQSLINNLRRHGQTLILRRGNSADLLDEIAAGTGATDLFFNREYEPGAVVREQQINQQLGQQVTLHRRAGKLLFEPEQILAGSGRPYKVFTPFWKACQASAEPRASLPIPEIMRAYTGTPIRSDRLESWHLLPSNPDWSTGIASEWQVGEASARQQLSGFSGSRVSAYPSERDRPDKRATARISAHLRFGEISPRQVWHALRSEQRSDESLQVGAEAFLRQLGWRDFSSHLLFHWPTLEHRPLRPAFEQFPWRDDPTGLQAWQQGRTGYPIVDAGMRELWHSGWMHNRVRMVAASFLVKHLLINWQFGERWFWDTLVDADLANNAAGWQWVAGCGTDAAPFFRIFNPTRQGERFDPGGDYVRRWIPELQALPDKLVHTPWAAAADLRRSAGIGDSYPLPIVDHKAARQRALQAFKELSE